MSNSETSTNKLRLTGELFFTALFLIAALLYVHTNDLRVGLQLILRVKASHADTLKLSIGQDSLEVKNNSANHFQEVCFLLPGKKIYNFKLNLGQKPGKIAIKSINVKSLFSNYQLKGKRLQKLFKEKHGVRSDYVKKQCYYIETTNPDHWLSPIKSFYQVLDQLQSNKTFYYLMAVVLTLLFFYFLHFFELRLLASRRRLSLKRLVNGILTFVFILVIFFPLVDRIFTLSGQSRLVEKRKMTKKPEFRWDMLFRYLNDYTSYYNDYFSFRSDLIFINNLLKVKIFNMSPTPKVLIGKEGWLFYDKPGTQPGTVDYYRSLTLFTPQELEQWKKVLEQRCQWLAARGILYLFIIVPNKNTIYPEFMPDRIRKAQQQSRFGQLKEYLENYSIVRPLDLRQALIEAKSQYPVYSKTDSHWNDFGAYIAHREIINYISHYFKGAVPLPLSRFNVETVNHMGGDLAIMLSLHEEILRENIIRMEPSPAFTFRESRGENISRYVRQIHTQCQTAPLPDILMVHDSCYHRLKSFLSEKFSRVLYIWDWDFNFYPEIIEHEKPTLVIDEMAERFLMGEIPINSF